MKIEIEFQDRNIHNALEEPHSNYWTNELRWDPVDWVGYVVDVEEDGEPMVEINREKIVLALRQMSLLAPSVFARVISNDTDGPDRDLFLQFVAFGEVKY